MTTSTSDAFDTVATGLLAGLLALFMGHLVALVVIANLARDSNRAIEIHLVASGGISLASLLPVWLTARRRSRMNFAKGVMIVLVPPSALGFLWMTLYLLVIAGFLRWEI